MKTIYFLGLEDIDGLNLIRNGKVGKLTFDAECGWTQPNANDVVIQDGDVLRGDPLMPCIRKQDWQEEAPLHVSDSKLPVDPNKTTPLESPSITYQVRWGCDQ